MHGVSAMTRSRIYSHLFDRAEKILAEIFPALIGDTIKFDFNLLKEFLIDLRLGNGTPARVLRQHEISAADLSVEEEE